MPFFCIIHIEDEYFELRGLLQTVRLSAETLLDELDTNVINYVTCKKVAVPKPDNSENNAAHEHWEIHEFFANDEKDPCIRYIFVASKRVPKELYEKVGSPRLFVVDALRTDNGDPDLVVSAPESIKDLEDNLSATAEEVVLYTAYDGVEEYGIAGKTIRRIHKSNEVEMKLLLGRITREYIRGGLAK